MYTSAELGEHIELTDLEKFTNLKCMYLIQCSWVKWEKEIERFKMSLCKVSFLFKKKNK